MIGLDSVPPDDRPPDNTMLHWAFDTMVGICTVLIGLGLWLGIAWWRKRDFPQTKWFLRAVAVSGVAAIVALECGWIVTEVGRQPWIVYNVMRTEDAVTNAERHLGHLHGRGPALRRARRRAGHHPAGDVAALARARTSEDDRGARTARPRRRPLAEEAAVSEADAVAVVLWVGVTIYAVFGGADFGAGFWSLLAGGGERGRRARELIDWAIGPVWEANHVWLIFVLVVLWTGVLAGVRGDLLDAVHPAQPGRVRDRAARRRLRLPQHRAARSRAAASPSGSSGSPRC